MTEEEIVRRCVELVWDFGEIYDNLDIEDFCSKELSTYPQHDKIVAYLNQLTEKDKQIEELKHNKHTIVDLNNTLVEKLEAENNKLLDVINNQDVKIADLEKKVKEYEQQLSAMEKGVCDVCKVADADYYEKQIADLEKKVGKLQKVNCEGLAELNHYNGELIIEVAKKDKQIEQAKEMLRMIIHSYNHKERFSFEKDLAKAAQFLEGQ